MYFKITNAKEKHFDYHYHDGLNVLVTEFNSNSFDKCGKGGFYFTNKKHIHEFYNIGIYLRVVELPYDDVDLKLIAISSKRFN